MKDTMHVKGLSELSKFLEQLPTKIEKNIMRSALRAGAKVIATEVRANVPVSEPSSRNASRYGGYAGALRDSIRINTGFDPKLGVVASVAVGGQTKSARTTTYYAPWVEYGTAAHWIIAKGQGSLSIGGFPVQRVMHPGAAPKPFVRPALDATASAAVVAVGQGIKKRLTKEGIDTAHVEIESSD